MVSFGDLGRAIPSDRLWEGDLNLENHDSFTYFLFNYTFRIEHTLLPCTLAGAHLKYLLNNSEGTTHTSRFRLFS